MGVDVSEEIERLRERLRVTNDSQLAVMLAVQRSTIAQWKKRGRIPEAVRVRAEIIAEGIEAADPNQKFIPACDPTPPGLKAMARAIALKYVINHVSSEEWGADRYIFLAMFMKHVEGIALNMLSSLIRSGSDPDKAYYSLINDPDLELKVAGIRVEKKRA